jgi:hypothetical protein
VSVTLLDSLEGLVSDEIMLVAGGAEVRPLELLSVNAVLCLPESIFGVAAR